MTKNILLAAAAVSAMAFAGAASAHTLTYRTIGAGGAIDTTETGVAANLPYALAAEASAITPAFATFALLDSLSTGASLPSGNTILTITLTNGTWATGGLPAGNINGTGILNCGTFTATPSAGGVAGGSTATFIISNSAAGCGSFNLDLPIVPGATGPVVVGTTLATEAGTPIDGLNASLTVVSRPSAFGVTIDSAIGAGALDDTFATLMQTPVYTQFRNGGGTGGHNNGTETITLGQLGTIQVTVNTAVHRDLADNLVALGDVTDADVVVTGNFSAFDGAGGDVLLGAASAKTLPNTLTATTATFNNHQVALTGGAVPFRVQRETAPVAIPSSNYSATVSYTLNTAFYNQEGPVTGPLETIQRDGTNVIFPWMNSTSVQNLTGSTNVVRLGNSGGVTGPVFAQVLNFTATGYTPAAAPVQLFPNIAANGERVISTAALTAALGEFGRGDVQISVEAPSNTITARRFATLANGDVTELTNGSVANDQSQVNVP